jgi:multidrug efflux system membrane fusion protein
LRTLTLSFCLLALLAGCRDKDDEKKAPPVAASKQAGADDDGPGVTLKPEAQTRAGVKVQALEETSLQPELVAYGKLEEDPSVSFVVRAPASGTLQIATAKTWPALGQSLASHAVFGSLEPRLQFADRLSLNTQTANAHADLNAAQSATAAAQTAYDRARALNADNKNVSDRVLQEASVRLAAEKAHEASARTLIQVLESPHQSLPLIAERGGDVLEVLAQPGESIEQGAPIARLGQLDHLLARVEIPTGEKFPPAGAAVRMTPTGFDDQAPLPAERVAIVSGTTLLYRLTRTAPGLRPGAAVTARFTLPGKAGEGVLIPRSAIVQQDGRSWVYVQTKADRFARKPVSTDRPAQAGFIVTRGFEPGDRLVIVGAQTLLSEEFKSKNEADQN